MLDSATIELIELAIAKKIETYHMYKDLSVRISNYYAKETLDSLAAEALKHKQILRNLYETHHEELLITEAIRLSKASGL